MSVRPHCGLEVLWTVRLFSDNSGQLMTRQSHWKTQCDIRWHTWRSGWVRVLTKWRFALRGFVADVDDVLLWFNGIFDKVKIRTSWICYDLLEFLTKWRFALRGFVVDVADVLLCFNGIFDKVKIRTSWICCCLMEFLTLTSCLSVVCYSFLTFRVIFGVEWCEVGASDNDEIWAQFLCPYFVIIRSPHLTPFNTKYNTKCQKRITNNL